MNVNDFWSPRERGRRYPRRRAGWILSTTFGVLSLGACDGPEGLPLPEYQRSDGPSCDFSQLGLHQAVTNGAGDLVYGGGFPPKLRVTNHPADVDIHRWAMDHDEDRELGGGGYVLYHMAKNDDTKIYQYRWNGSSYDYSRTIQIDAAGMTEAKEAGLSTAQFGMAHDSHQNTHRLFFLGMEMEPKVYQFVLSENQLHTEGARFTFLGTHHTPPIKDLPQAADLTGWAMVHEDYSYFFYAWASSSHDKILQYRYNHVDGYDLQGELDVIGFPQRGNGRFSMLESTQHLDGGVRRHLYIQGPVVEAVLPPPNVDWGGGTCIFCNPDDND